MRIVPSLDEQFARLHERSVELVQAISADKLYTKPRHGSGPCPSLSCGEHILRSAGVVEQTFGGIMVNLWDDPFEWTLPESLPQPSDVISYLKEVESTRSRAFGLFKSDDELLREIATPPGNLRSLFSVITEALTRAAHHQGRAFATFCLVDGKSLPRV